MIVTEGGDIKEAPRANKKCPCGSKKVYKKCACYVKDVQRKREFIERATSTVEADKQVKKQQTILLL